VHARGATEVKQYVRDRLGEGLPVDQVVRLTAARYGGLRG